MFVLEHGIMNMQSPIALFNAKLAKTANHSATASADSLGGSAIERINDPHIMDKLLATLTARGALRGIAIYLLDDDRGRDLYLAVQGVWQREFKTPDEVSAFLDLIEGRA